MSTLQRIIDSITKPETRKPSPEPLKINLKLVFGIITFVWALATIITAVLALTANTSWVPVWICCAGVVIGCCLLAWNWLKFGRQQKN